MLARANALAIPLRDEVAHVCVTSPPYWALRDYGEAGQIGLERTPELYAAAMVTAFREVRRVLRPDGALWLNLGDGYAAGGHGGGGIAVHRAGWARARTRTGFRAPPPGLKEKDLTLAPFMVAAALRADGWYLRSVIIWEKAVATEPPRLDRPSNSHEYLFLLAKKEAYGVRSTGETWWHKTVWRMPADADPLHPATMPRELARRAIVSSSPPGGLVVDPFIGAGAVARVAEDNGRRWFGSDLSPVFLAQAKAKASQLGLLGRAS